MLGTQASIAANPSNLAEAVAAAEAVTLDLPAGRGDALWQLIAGIWTPLVRRELGLKEADAKAYAWMMVIAFWGMRQLVRDGDVSRARGMKLFGEMVERLSRP
ncbi:MAG TPA: hypothetical protein VFM56_06570, partial [Solimonas sp.]|nr:hypothetical protein [Solimonas sp.]